MEEQAISHRRRLQVTIGLLMLVVATSALIFALVRPDNHTAVIRRAIALAAANRPDVVASEFQAAQVGTSADQRYWVVRLSRKSSPPSRPLTVVVPKSVVSR